MNNLITAKTPSKKGVFLSQATRLNDFKKGSLNMIFASVSSGKTTYVSKVLPNSLDYQGAFIFLAPYNSLKAQTTKSHLFEEADEEFYKALEGFVQFSDDELISPHINLTGKKVALTTQSFLWALKKNPALINQVGVIVFDEFDHVLYNLPNWNRNKNDPFKTIESTLIQIMEKVYIVGITATNRERLLSQWGEKANEIKFAEPLRELELGSLHSYSDLLYEIEKLQSQNVPNEFSRIAIFIKHVKMGVYFKNELEQKGYTVDLLVSDNAKNYTMNSHELKLKSQIENSGRGDFSQILIFNSTLERGVNILDNSFSHVFVHDSNEIVRTQVLGRFRFNGIHGYYLLNKTQREQTYTLPDEFWENYLDRKLSKEDKEELAQLLQWKNPLNSRLLKWTSIHKILLDSFPISSMEVRERENGSLVRSTILKFKPTI